jgi:N-acetylglucosaminyl-diphospho-decaprenol L-rhamnosyltransferase
MSHPPPTAPRACLSIVIVSFNTAALLRACLLSLPWRSDDLALDVIVVDNGSTDGSADMVAAAFPAARLIALADNTGFAAATNRGLARARGAFLCLLNPDTVVAPGALEAVVAWLAAHPRAGVAAPRLLNPDGSPQAVGFRFPGPWQVALDWFPLHPRLLGSRLNGRYPPPWPAPFRIDHPLGACFIVRRAAAATVGLLDEGYFMYSEEVDWCRRLAAAGWEAWTVPAATVVHHGGASTRQQPARMFLALHRSRDRYLRRWLPPGQYRLTRLIARVGATVEAARTYQRRVTGSLPREAARARVRACGQIARGWPTHPPARVGRLPDADDG